MSVTETARAYLRAQAKEKEHRETYEEAKKERVRLQRLLLDEIADAGLEGVSVDGRNLSVVEKPTVKWRDGVSFRRPEVRQAFESAGLGDLYEPRITTRDLQTALKQLQEFQGDIPEDLTKFVEVGRYYDISNRKA